MRRARALRIIFASWAATTAILACGGSALATFPGSNGRIAYSYDPGSIGGEASIATVDPSGGESVLLSPAGVYDISPSYSPDGERIVFDRSRSDGGSEIRVMNADGSGNAAVISESSGVGVGSPAFSPDAGQIAFARSDSSGSQIYVMNADGTNPTQLTSGSLLSGSPSYSSSGKIVFTRLMTSGMSFETSIWTMNADGSDQVQLAIGSAPSWSPDGTRIAFARIESGGQRRIYVMNADGSGQVPVIADGQSPAFSPDGTRIAFTRSDQFLTFENLFVADVDGQNETQLTFGTGDRNGSPDWQALAPPSCALDAKASKSVKRAKVEVTCANEDATVTLEGSGKARRTGAAAASKAAKFKIPPVTETVPQGGPTTITVKIPKQGQRAIKRAGGRAKATIDATFTDGFGVSTTDTQKLKFKPKK